MRLRKQHGGACVTPAEPASLARKGSGMHRVGVHPHTHYLAVHLWHGRFPRAPSASTRRGSAGAWPAFSGSPGGRGSSISACEIHVRSHREEASVLRQRAKRPRMKMQGRRTDPGDAEEQQAERRAERGLRLGRPRDRHVCVCLVFWIRPKSSFYWERWPCCLHAPWECRISHALCGDLHMQRVSDPQMRLNRHKLGIHTHTSRQAYKSGAFVIVYDAKTIKLSTVDLFLLFHFIKLDYIHLMVNLCGAGICVSVICLIQVGYMRGFKGGPCQRQPRV